MAQLLNPNTIQSQPPPIGESNHHSHNTNHNANHNTNHNSIHSVNNHPPDLKSVTSPSTDDSVDTLNASPPHNIYKAAPSHPQSTTTSTSLPYYGVWNIPPYYSTTPTSYYSPLTQPIYPTTFVNNSNLLDYPTPLSTTAPVLEPSTSQLQLSRTNTGSNPILENHHNHHSALSVVPQSPNSEISNPVSPAVAMQTQNHHLNHHHLEPEHIHGGPTSPAIAPPMQDSKYIDITEYLNLPQSQAAKKLHVPTSTLSKRWKEAVRNRKWPYRAVCKLDKEIMTTLYNIPQSGEASSQSDDLPPDVKAKLGRLLRDRQDLLKPVFIRL